jgi:uncharacterized protein YdhG (YjbR/CyaY superfamily)
MDQVEDFIAALDSPEKAIVKRLRAIILDVDPRIQEKLSYGVPYFYHHRRICFLWPASHLPCPVDKIKSVPEKVQLGFCYGNLLSNEQGVLLAEGRKQVYLLKFTSLKEINDHVIREIVQEAVMVDDEFGKKSKNLKKRK